MRSEGVCWTMMAILINLSAASIGEAQSVFPGTDWQEATPESQGVDSAKLKEAIAYLDAHAGPDGAKELVIVHHGRLIWAGPNADAYHTVFSCTKTFTSAVLGLLVEDGRCGLDSPAIAFEPNLADEYPLYRKIRLRHLVSMCGGYRGEVKDVRPEDQPWGDVMAYLNPRPPAFEAGTAVQYNDHDVFLLGKILTLLVREPLQDVFQRRIAGPIGIRKWEWGVSGTVDGTALNNPPGNPGGRGAGGVKVTPREMARFGLLMLNRGSWNGRQLLDASFVDEATSNQVPVSIGFRNRDFRGRYGYYWWVNGVMADGKRPWPSAPPKTYMSHGNGGNFCCVVPEWNLVLVRMGRPSINDRLWEAFFALLADAISSDGDSKAGATKPVTLADSAAAAHRVGDWQIARWPGLAVVADPHGGLIHLVYGDDQRLYYTRGTDNGQSWSKPDMIVHSGMHPRLALDSARTLHLVYCTPRVRFPGDRIPKEGCYVTLRDGKWSSPIKVSQPDQGAVDVRIAVDGDDNVHVIYWSLGTPSGELGEHDNHRCYYRRKPAGSSDFEEALCFENSVATGPSSHGALAVGPRGEVHVLYRTFQTSPAWTGNLEYRVREKDGTWRGEPEAFRGVYLADHSLSAAVDAQGTLHVAGYTFRPSGFKLKCYRKEPNGSLEVAFVEDDTYGTSTDIVPTPSGDLWLTGSGNWSTRSRAGTPRSRYYHYDAARRQWTEESLSPEGSINVDTFCLGPRLLRYDDQIRVFYAQKEADQQFRLYQRVLAHAGWDEVALKRLHRTVDLSLGESQAVELSDGKTTTVKLLDLEETRDEMPCSAVRAAYVKVQVNGQSVTLTSATYHLPVTVAGVQIDCPITKGYVQNARTNRWGLDKDARLRLWPAGSPWIAPGTFVYPARQRWFASDTQMANEPVFANGDEKPENSSIYYHWGLDIGGCEGMVAVVSATDGVVVSDGKNVLAGHEDVPGIAPTYDEVNILDARGWYYCYCHLQSIDPAVRLGQTVKMGQRIGTLGKEGSSGGWSHLHFHITARQPSGKWGIEEGYAFLWQAYRTEHAPGLLAVARPHHFAAIGQKVTLDGTRSWSAAGPIASYEWTCTDGTTAGGARVERTYDCPGTYSEILKITDARGDVDYDFAVVQVVDAANPKLLPPTIHATYAPTFGIRPGAAVTFKVRTFRTTAGEERWDFGDGNPMVRVRSDGNVKPRAIDGYAETVHRYTQPGHYVVCVERSAKDGSKATAHLQVRVTAP